ncbi:SGNH/GDSL hydrolase family protein [Actinoplanes awajinensis]|uniref:SGNH/GDSL hydrolase family protein n=1 Tax=Actinoplanes awajinensis TaxID=135946 RepID=UPI000A024DE9|nr:SGNH/GDSL hydrolase family protein [Actinoplanes awajinensis]
MTGHRYALARTVALGLAALLGCTSWGPAVTSARDRAVLARPGAVNVLALGDSVPAGTACGCVPFPGLYARRLAGNAHTINLARPGIVSADVLAQAGDPADRPAFRSASVIVIMIGANDLAAVFDADGDTAAYRRAAGTVEANVAAALERIRAVRRPSVPVLVVGYWNVLEDGDAAQQDYSADDTARAAVITGYTNDALRAAAAAGAATFVPTLTAFKGADGTADPTRLLADDGDHPNAEGHATIAAALYAARTAVAP